MRMPTRWSERGETLFRESEVKLRERTSLAVGLIIGMVLTGFIVWIA